MPRVCEHRRGGRPGGMRVDQEGSHRCGPHDGGLTGPIRHGASLGTCLEVLEGRACSPARMFIPFCRSCPATCRSPTPSRTSRSPSFRSPRWPPGPARSPGAVRQQRGEDRLGQGPAGQRVDDHRARAGLRDRHRHLAQRRHPRRQHRHDSARRHGPAKTYVTGQTVASAHVLTSGTVLFNRLIDTSGVKSIVLNGFTLEETVTPPAAAAGENASLFLNTGIYLTGGVGLLQFHNIVAPQDQAQAGADQHRHRRPLDGSADPGPADHPARRDLQHGLQQRLDGDPDRPADDPDGQYPGQRPDCRGSTSSPRRISRISRRGSVHVPDRRDHGPDRDPGHGIDHLNVRGSAVNVTAARSRCRSRTASAGSGTSARRPSAATPTRSGWTSRARSAA